MRGTILPLLLLLMGVIITVAGIRSASDNGVRVYKSINTAISHPSISVADINYMKPVKIQVSLTLYITSYIYAVAYYFNFNLIDDDYYYYYYADDVR